MWVFRITKGYSFDDPFGGCPVGVNIERVKEVIRTKKKNSIVYDGDVEWVQNELLQGRLRQGWGVPGLDLRLRDNIWVENYLIACCKYWGGKLGETTCSEAMGRKKILDCMNKMEKGDIVFVPKTPVDCEFIVATVRKKYDFDNATYPEKDFRNNFRHIIEVKNIEHHSNSELKAGIFGSPFMHAIDIIKPKYKSYRIFDNFINNNH